MSAVTISGGMLQVGEERARWLSGSVHYWRHDPADWPAVLDSVVATGIGMIDTYVPWQVHEQADTSLDFTGQLDVGAFLRMAQNRGIRASIRPGPACGAELSTHGYPRRVLDIPGVQGLRCSGLPYILPSASHFFRVPSYASSAFRQEIRRWYRAVGGQLAPLQAPDGPIVAVQIDNEMGYFFQAHAYALDYHPEALAEWRQYVLRLHGSLDAVNAAYGTRVTSVAELEPPRDGSDPCELRRVEWVMFREEHIRTTLAALADDLRSAGFDRTVLFHNDYARTETPMDQRALESAGSIDVAGVDAYSSRHGGRWIADIGRQLAAMSRMPLIPELGTGWISLPWVIPAGVRPHDQEMVTMAAFLAGVQGGNFYMLAERDRWYGSPISNSGRLRDEHVGFFQRFAVFLEEARLEELERDVRVLLLEPRAEYRREAARAVLGDIVPAYREVMPFDFRLADPGAVGGDARAWYRGMRDAIRAAGLDCDLGVTSAPPLRLDRYELIAVPVLELLDQATLEALAVAVAGGTTVCVGPGIPLLDERLHEVETNIRVTQLRSPVELRDHLPSPTVRCTGPGLDLFHWHGRDRSVIAVLNHGQSASVETIDIPTARSWRELWPEPQIAAGLPTPTMTTELGPFGVAAWELVH